MGSWGGRTVELQSDLWLDQPDAHDQIDAHERDGDVSAEEAALLHIFVDDGYIKFHLPIDEDFSRAFDDEVSQIWEQRPADLAISLFDGPTAFCDYDGRVRNVGYRIPDLHSHGAHALDLYLHPTLFRMVELIYGEPAISFQSLYFEYGSQQALHRDPMYVVTDPASHLLASWVALEDIAPESGPLAYVPRSHRLPWFEFEPGTVVCGQRVPAEQREAFEQWKRDTLHDRALDVEAFTCRRGDAFIWHAGLLHGGTRIGDRSKTRKSFVVHYCTAADYTSRGASMRVRDGDGWRRQHRRTDTVIERGHGRGLDNPLRT
jgi:phytanoyl-CoA hydroxylase